MLFDGNRQGLIQLAILISCVVDVKVDLEVAVAEVVVVLVLVFFLHGVAVRTMTVAAHTALTLTFNSLFHRLALALAYRVLITWLILDIGERVIIEES